MCPFASPATLPSFHTPNSLLMPRSTAAPVRGFRRWTLQLRVTLSTSLVRRCREPALLLLQLGQVGVYVLLLYLVAASIRTAPGYRISHVDAPSPTPFPVPPRPAGCPPTTTPNECLEVVYSPVGSPTVDRVVMQLRDNSDLDPMRIRGFRDMAEVDAFLLHGGTQVLAAIHFDPPAHEVGANSPTPTPTPTPEPTPSFASPPNTLGYILQTDTTPRYFKGRFSHPNLDVQVPLQIATERAIAEVLSGIAFDWEVTLVPFAHPPLSPQPVEGAVAPMFVLAAAITNQALVLFAVLSERETGLRAYLEGIGLGLSPYWLSWWTWEWMICVLDAGFLLGLGYALDIKLLTGNGVGLVFTTLAAAFTSTTALGFLGSSWLRSTQAGVGLCFAEFIVGWLMSVTVNLYVGFPYRAGADGTSVHAFWRFVYNALPFGPLAKALMDLDRAAQFGTTGGDLGLTWATRDTYCHTAQSTHPPAGGGVQSVDMDWSSISSSSSFRVPDCTLSLGDVLALFGMQTVIYLLLALYFDQVLPDTLGQRRCWYYFVLPSFWWPPLSSSSTTTTTKKKDRGGGPGSGVARGRRALALVESESDTSLPPISRSTPYHARVHSSAVLEKERAVRDAHRFLSPIPSSSQDFHTGTTSTSIDANLDVPLPLPAMLVMGLTKIFHPLTWWARLRVWSGILPPPSPVVAVNKVWFSVPSRGCLAILGPNGAGKTTLIHLLTGAQTATEGDALIDGHFVQSETSRASAQAALGVCPQFDALYHALTAREHVHLVAAIRGIPSATWSEVTDDLLDRVGLIMQADESVGTYSGGMRRRLSVALALVGRPPVVILDEPTTGMDPISRRQVWDLIYRVKQSCAVILTTHSMEEAERLSDQVMVYTRGEVTSRGSPLQLKHFFVAPHQLHVTYFGGSTGHGEGVGDRDRDRETVIRGLLEAAGAICDYHEDTDDDHDDLPIDPSTPFASAGENHRVYPDPCGLGRGKGKRGAGRDPMVLSVGFPHGHDEQMAGVLTHLEEHKRALGVLEVRVSVVSLEKAYLAAVAHAEGG